MENNQSTNPQPILTNEEVLIERDVSKQKSTAFDTKKFELENDLKKITLPKKEYEKWLRTQENAQKERCERQKSLAKIVAISVAVSFVIVAFIITIVVVSLNKK